MRETPPLWPLAAMLPARPLAATLPALLLAPGAALAHTGVGEASGLAHGLAHPLGGLDHVLAMVAVGLLAARLGGRALWTVPAGFLGAMTVGAMLGASGVALPFVETGIALSVVALGAAVASGVRLPVVAATVLAAAFAVFHGAAHGAELPAGASGLCYGAGFLAATALLHASGIVLGLGVARLGGARGPSLGRAGGAAIALAGVLLLGGVA